MDLTANGTPLSATDLRALRAVEGDIPPAYDFWWYANDFLPLPRSTAAWTDAGDDALRFGPIVFHFDDQDEDLP